MPVYALKIFMQTYSLNKLELPGRFPLAKNIGQGKHFISIWGLQYETKKRIKNLKIDPNDLMKST